MPDIASILAKLPPVCFATKPWTNETVLILRGEPGYIPFDRPGSAEKLNAALPPPPTPEQVEAMLAGSMFGWHVPLADPDRVRRGTEPGKPQCGAEEPLHQDGTNDTRQVGGPLVSPNGTAIRGTLERLAGVALGTVSRADDGTVAIEYTGGTEIYWDEQRTVTREGPSGMEQVFIDENGCEWLESDLVEASRRTGPGAAEQLPGVVPAPATEQDLVQYTAVVTDWGAPDAYFRVKGEGTIYMGQSPDLDRLWRYAAGHLGFYGWLRVVNWRTERIARCCLLDLPARDWRAEYEGRVPPDEAADVAYDEYAAVHGTGPVTARTESPPGA